MYNIPPVNVANQCRQQLLSLHLHSECCTSPACMWSGLIHHDTAVLSSLFHCIYVNVPTHPYIHSCICIIIMLIQNLHQI